MLVKIVSQFEMRTNPIGKAGNEIGRKAPSKQTKKGLYIKNLLLAFTKRAKCFILYMSVDLLKKRQTHKLYIKWR